MKIRLLKSWNMTDAGQVLDVTNGVAALLIGRKIAVAVDEVKNIVRPPMDKMVRRSTKTKGVA